jgi:thymidylate kinase
MAIETYREYLCSLEEKKFLVFDRYTPTIENFQLLRFVEEGYNLKDSFDWLKKLSLFIPEEALTFYLDIDVNTSISRLKKRGKDNLLRQEFNDIDRHKANFIHNLYNKMAEKKSNTIILEGDRGIDEIFSDIYFLLSDFSFI